MRDDDLRIVFDWICEGKLAFCGLLAANDFPLQFFASVKIDAARIRHVTAGTHNVEIIFFANLANCVVVSYPESVRLRRLQLVEDLAILVTAFGERRSLILILRASDYCKTAAKTGEYCDDR